MIRLEQNDLEVFGFNLLSMVNDVAYYYRVCDGRHLFSYSSFELKCDIGLAVQF